MSTALRSSCTCLVALLTLAACGDSSSLDPRVASARKYEDTLRAARKVLAEIPGNDPAENRANADALRAAAGSCKAPSDSLPSQKAAFARTASILLREAARLDLEAIETLQAKQRAAVDRLLLCLERAKAMKELQALRPSVDDEPARRLEAEVQSASAMADEAESKARAAQEQLDERQAEVDARSRAAAELEVDANAKHVAASSAPTTMEAMTLTEKASQTALRAIEARAEAAAAELRVAEVRPVANGERLRAEALRAKIERLKTCGKSIEATIAAHEAERQTLAESERKLLEEARGSAEALERISGELRERMTAAAESLEQAAGQAQQGASGPAAADASAKLSSASTNLARAMLQERWAGGSSLEASAFDSMAQSSGDSRWSKLAANAREDRAAASAKVVGALEAADADLPADTNASLLNLKERIARARSAHEAAKPVEPAAPATSGSDPAQPADKPADAPAGDGGDQPPAAEPVEPAAAPETPSNEPAAEPPATEPAPAEPAPGR